MVESRLPTSCLDGAWRRAGRAVDGGPFVEQSNVLWLQTGTYFADLRVPDGPVEPAMSYLDDAQAFSGHSRYDPPRVTWLHDLDTMARPPGYEDTALVEDHGALLVERGEGYVERWQRQRISDWSIVLQRNDPGSGAPVARTVVVAHLALAVWAGPVAGGVSLVHRRGKWTEVASVGGGGAGAARRILAALEALVEGETKTAAGWQKVS